MYLILSPQFIMPLLLRLTCTFRKRQKQQLCSLQDRVWVKLNNCLWFCKSNRDRRTSCFTWGHHFSLRAVLKKKSLSCSLPLIFLIPLITPPASLHLDLNSSCGCELVVEGFRRRKWRGNDVIILNLWNKIHF